MGYKYKYNYIYLSVQVVTVDPKDISKEFSSILAIPTIANDVNCNIVLHKELYVSTA